MFGWLFGLNRLKVYIASHISNPLMAAPLYAAELQLGAWLRSGSMYSFASLGKVHVWGVAQDLFLGSVVIGASIAAVGAAATYIVVNRRSLHPALARLIDDAAARYLPTGCTSWEFANGKLRGDPIYREILKRGVLPPEGTLADLGCGQGLMLAFIATARKLHTKGLWPPPTWPDPPTGLRLYGIENRPRMVERCRQALGSDATILLGDLRVIPLPRCDVALLFDVVHLMPRGDQDRLLSRTNEALEPGGMLILREADAGGGWRFLVVRCGNWLCRAVQGQWGRRFHFRTAAEWRERLVLAGFEVETQPMGEGTPFANVLLYARRAPAG